MSKILTLAVGAGAYVLGAKAGRQRYDQIMTTARRAWSDPRVQKTTSQAGDMIKDKAPEVRDQMASAVKQATSKVKSSDQDDARHAGSPAAGRAGTSTTSL